MAQYEINLSEWWLKACSTVLRNAPKGALGSWFDGHKKVLGAQRLTDSKLVMLLSVLAQTKKENTMKKWGSVEEMRSEYVALKTKSDKDMEAYLDLLVKKYLKPNSDYDDKGIYKDKKAFDAFKLHMNALNQVAMMMMDAGKNNLAQFTAEMKVQRKEAFAILQKKAKESESQKVKAYAAATKFQHKVRVFERKVDALKKKPSAENLVEIRGYIWKAFEDFFFEAKKLNLSKNEPYDKMEKIYKKISTTIDRYEWVDAKTPDTNPGISNFCKMMEPLLKELPGIIKQFGEVFDNMVAPV